MKTSNEKYEFEPHGPWVPGVYKVHCQKCGLVRLNNSFTDWAVSMGCNNQDHPMYEFQRSKASTLNGGKSG